MRRYLVHFLLAAWVTAVPFLLFAWWAEGVTGDLTRIGHWSEHDFGPRRAEAPIVIEADPVGRVDIQLLGDSFSERNLWQSIVARRTGLAWRSYDFRANCIDDWLDVAIADRNSRWIIIETVERSFVPRFSRPVPCVHRAPVSFAVRGGLEPPPPGWPTLSLGYLVPTAWHSLALRTGPQGAMHTKRTVNVPLRANCALFSHRRSDRLLYLADDEQKAWWSPDQVRDAVENVLAIQRRVERAGKEFVFVVAPDKSTVYRPCLEQGSIGRFDTVAGLVVAGVRTVDLATAFGSRLSDTEDLYDPNNTHWGTSGYELVANELYGALRAR